MKLGEKLQLLRKENGMSQEQLALKLGVSRQAISKWELSETRPDIDSILKMSEIFQVTTDYLLKEEMQENTQYLPSEKEKLLGKNLLTISIGIMFFGLVVGWGLFEWKANNGIALMGFAIQVIGLIIYCVGKNMLRTRTSEIIRLIIIALMAFMPISMVTLNVPIPYLGDIYAIEILIGGYVTLLICYVIIRVIIKKVQED